VSRSLSSLLSVAIAFPSTRRLNVVLGPEIAHAWKCDQN
jgi:hypothetical protein